MNAQVAHIHSPIGLAAACAALENAKKREEEAVAVRRKAEATILAYCGELPAEGTTHHEAGLFRATVTTAVRRSVDQAMLADIASEIPEAIGRRLIRWKPELVTRELRFIESNEPEIYATLAKAITAKPAKPSIRVDRISPEPEAA